MAAWAWFVVSYFHPRAADSVGRWAVLLFVGTLVWTGMGVHREIAELRPDPQLTPRENLAAELAAVVLGALVLAPAVTLGVLVMRDAW